MRICRIFELPESAPLLAAIAHCDGHSNVERLISEFNSGTNRFDQVGEGLFAAIDTDELVGIGGVNVDPYAERRIARVRRLYVHPDHRRFGVASALMREIEALARSHFPGIQLFTSSSEAGSFYERLGYHAVADQHKVSHAKWFSRSN